MRETCANCEGTGNVSCGHCGSSGRMPDVSVLDEACHECHGTGELPCPECNGTGALAARVADPWEKQQT